jgi:tetratricopeptide (TPR) repeat protein
VAERLTREQPDNVHFITAVASVCLNRGNLDTSGGRPRDALPWYERAIRAAEAALAKDGRLTEARTWREYAHGARAKAHEQLGDFAAALRDWDRIVELADGEDRRVYRLMRILALAQAGAGDRVAAEADALSAGGPDAPTLFHLASACATAAARADADGRLTSAERRAKAGALAAQATALLRRALAAADLKLRGEIVLEMITNPDLRSLGDRAGGQPPPSHRGPR